MRLLQAQGNYVTHMSALVRQLRWLLPLDVGGRLLHKCTICTSDTHTASNKEKRRWAQSATIRRARAAAEVMSPSTRRCSLLAAQDAPQVPTASVPLWGSASLHSDIKSVGSSVPQTAPPPASQGFPSTIVAPNLRLRCPHLHQKQLVLLCCSLGHRPSQRPGRRQSQWRPVRIASPTKASRQARNGVGE